MRPGALEQRMKEQAEVLDRAAQLVKPGGRIAYVTCSVLAEENGDQVQGFRRPPPGFLGEPAGRSPGAAGRAGGQLRGRGLATAEGLQMTPRRTGTDGFFVSLLSRRS